MQINKKVKIFLVVLVVIFLYCVTPYILKYLALSGEIYSLFDAARVIFIVLGYRAIVSIQKTGVVSLKRDKEADFVAASAVGFFMLESVLAIFFAFSGSILFPILMGIVVIIYIVLMKRHKKTNLGQ